MLTCWRSRARAAFTMVEILVALAIIAILAAILVPTVGSQLRQGKSTAVANQLSNLRSSIDAYRQNVVRFPLVLTVLTTLPGATAVDACGTVVPAANRALWRGPYLNDNILGDFPVGDATILNQLVRIPAAGAGAPGILEILAINVDSTVAADLEAQFDGTPIVAASYTTGTIQWTAAGLDTLKFLIPIRGC